MRLMDAQGITYHTYMYEKLDGNIDGISVAKKIGKAPEQVFKTLVACGTSKEQYVFVIPVVEELDLKKTAKVSGEKKIDMIPSKDLYRHTGYVRGGCSPVGMKKRYQTFIAEQAKLLPTIIVSAGKIGLQVEVAVNDLATITNARFADVIK